MDIIDPATSHVLYDTLIHALFLVLCLEKTKLYIESTFIINPPRSQVCEINMHCSWSFVREKKSSYRKHNYNKSS